MKPLHRALHGLLPALALACTLIAASPARAQLDAATAESLMRQSGLWLQLDGIAQQVRAGTMAALARSPSPPSAAELERLTGTIDATYATERLRATALASLTGSIDTRQVSALRSWFDSPLGRAVTQLEEASAADTTEPALALQQGSALLEAMAAERRTVLVELVQVSRTAEVVTELTISTSVAALRGLASVQPAVPADAVEQLQATLEQQRPQMLQAFAGMSGAAFAKAYQSLQTADLARYAEFLKSPAGRHFSEVAARALEAALVEASTDYGRRLPATRDRASA